MSIGKEIQHFIPFDFQFQPFWQKLDSMDCNQIVTERLYTFIVKRKSVQKMKKVHVRQNEFQMVRNMDLNHYSFDENQSFFHKNSHFSLQNDQFADEKWHFLDIFDTQDP